MGFSIKIWIVTIVRGLNGRLTFSAIILGFCSVFDLNYGLVAKLRLETEKYLTTVNSHKILAVKIFS